MPDEASLETAAWPLAPGGSPAASAPRVVRASALNFLARAGSGAAALGLAVLTTNVLNTSDRGIYAILVTWAGIGATVITGATTVLAADLIHGRHARPLLHSAVSAIAVGSAVFLLPFSAAISTVTDAVSLPALLWTAAVTVLLSYSAFEMSIAQARGDVLRVSLTDIGMAGFPLVATVAAAVILEPTVTTLVAAWAIGALIIAALLFTCALPAAILMAARAWRVAGSIMRRSVGVAFANGVGILCQRIDVLVVAAVLSTSAAGVYSISVALAANLMLISRSLLTATYHSIMTAPATDVATRLSTALRHSVILVLGVGALSVPVVALTAGFVFGEAYGDVWQAYALLVPAIACLCVAEMLRHFLLTRQERQREFVIVATGMLVLNGVLAVVGSAAFGLMGAAASTALAYAAGTIALVAICAAQLSVTMRELALPRRSDVAAYWRAGRSAPGRLRRRRSE